LGPPVVLVFVVFTVLVDFDFVVDFDIRFDLDLDAVGGEFGLERRRVADLDLQFLGVYLDLDLDVDGDCLVVHTNVLVSASTYMSNI
jgi:hypothetical protein